MALREYDFEKEPTVSVVKKILNDAIKMKATDIHFDPTDDELIIKFRINGDLVEYTTAPESVKINIATRVKILAGMNITESLIPQIGSIVIDSDSKSHTMRVSSLPVADGEKIVAHITNYSNSVKDIKKLGFNDEDVKKIKEMLNEQQGIILVTGNANSGKTTTIYSILKELNNKENNIISIEEPICMKIKGINQVEICPEKGLTYRNVLKNILLQDPNVIAINELVDDEVARYALRASISGRLVVAGLQSKTIFQTIDNLLHMDVENYLLGSNLKGIISQRLVKRLCPMCREKKKATDYEKTVIKNILGKDVNELYYPCGCDDCKDGYIGFIPVAEVVSMDSELRHAISNGKALDLIKSIIYEENKSILKDGFSKAINGDTSFQEIIRIMDLDTDFKENDVEIKNLILGKTHLATINEEKTDDENDNIVKKEKDEKKLDEVPNNSEDNIEKRKKEDLNKEENSSIGIQENDENKKDTSIKEEKKNIDAKEEMDNAKELLNKLMGKSKKTVVEKDNKEEAKEKKEDTNEINHQNVTSKPIKDDKDIQQKKKSSFNLNDIDDSDDDDDDFNYNGYENNF